MGILYGKPEILSSSSCTPTEQQISQSKAMGYSGIYGGIVATYGIDTAWSLLNGDEIYSIKFFLQFLFVFQKKPLSLFF
jgi:hypothetical protein